MPHVDEYSKHQEDFARFGVKLVFIGSGSIKKAKEYCKNMNLKGDMFVDPSKNTFQHMDFPDSGIKGFFDKKGLELSKEATKNGYNIDYSPFGVGSYTQLGGICILGPEQNEDVFVWKCAAPYDYPPVDEVVKRLEDSHVPIAAN